ncbi:MAG TPA: hypothetical protein VHD91_00550 [Gaiellaceae bacterium]|nr:hypothetical protein [Gaiellaceae bacterium]
MSQPFDTFSPPPPEPDPWATEDEGATLEDEALDPRAAAALLEQTTRSAARRFDQRPTILFVAAAVTVLVGYGAVWLSVRHQHPYSGPTGAALGVLYGVLAAWIVLNVVLMQRSLTGRTSPRRRIEALVFTPIWVLIYVYQGALYHTDHSHAIAYGVWPAVAPLLVVGSAAAGYFAGQQRRVEAGFAVAAVALAAIGAFAGPAGVWGVMGVGLCILLAIGGAAQYRQRRG